MKGCALHGFDARSLKPITAGVHGEGEAVGSTEEAHEERYERVAGGLEALPEGAVVEVGAAGALGLAYLSVLDGGQRDEAQGERQDERHIIYRYMQFLQRR